MSQDPKFQQRWEFRRRDDDKDSSSDDSKSGFGGEPVLKKHKLVSNLVVLESDETSNAPLCQQDSQVSQQYPDMGTRSECGKADKMQFAPSNEIHEVKNRMKRDSTKKRNQKKNNRSKHELVSLDDFDIFVKSIIEELKVARENMFTRMREEMKKLVPVKLALRSTKKKGTCMQKNGQRQYQNHVELGAKTQNRDGGSLERSEKRDGTTDLNNCNSKNGKGIYQNHVEFGMNSQNCDGGSLERSKKRDGAIDLNNCNSKNGKGMHPNHVELGMESHNCDGGSLERHVNRDGSHGTTDLNNCNSKNGKGLYQNHVELGRKMQNCIGGPLERSVKRDRKTDLNSGQGHFQSHIELGMKPPNNNCGLLLRSVERDGITDLNNCHEVLEEHGNYDQTIPTSTSSGKENVKQLRLSSKKQNYPSNPSGLVVSSPYLTLPTVLSEPRAENNKLESSCHYNQSGAAGNKTAGNLERGKLLGDADTVRGYSSGIQQGEQIGSFSQMASQNMAYLYPYSTHTSTMGTGFPIPLLQGLKNGFNISSQAPENSPQGNNFFGLRMNGGAIRISGESQALSEQFVSSNFRSQMHNKTDCGLQAFGNQDLKEGRT